MSSMLEQLEPYFADGSADVRRADAQETLHGGVNCRM